MNSTILKHAAVIVGLLTLVWLLFIGGGGWLLQMRNGKETLNLMLGGSVALVVMVIAYELFAGRESDQL
jgi:hypothetical protein